MLLLEETIIVVIVVLIIVHSMVFGAIRQVNNYKYNSWPAAIIELAMTYCK